MHSARMTSRGRITIPAEIRDELGLKAGDILVVEQVGREIVMQVRRESCKGDVPADHDDVDQSDQAMSIFNG